MPRPVRLTKSLGAADANGIALSQTPLAGGDLTLNGVFASGSPAVAVLDTPRRVLLTFASDETGRVFTVYGYNAVVGGSLISETVAGTATTASTTLDFGRVTRVTVDAATAGAVEVGTNGVGATPWQMVDWNLDPTKQVIAVDVTGTVDYTVQYTYDDIMGEYQGLNWVPGYPTKIWDDAVVVNESADAEATYDYPITAWRVQINSGDGELRIVGVQAGVGGIAS